jgi:Fibronectin type III domain
VNTEGNCVDGVNCEVYTLTVSSTPAAWAAQRVQVQLNWASVANEYDIYIHQGTLTGPLVASAVNGPGLTNQTAFIDPATWGTGVFVVHVVYDTTPTAATDHYTGTASAVALTPAGPPPATPDTGPKIGYENFEAPGVLTPVTATNSGGDTVEYMGRNAGEPSIGVDWNTGIVNLQSDLETLFITFDGTCPANGQTTTWVNRRAPTSQLIDSDPIGFTDRQTGRVFAAELTLLSPDGVKISYSDDDGNTWVPTQSGGLASAVDHETIGGGPFHAPLTGTPAYANAIYYCSQDLEAALCSRSDDGGLTYGPSVVIYTFSQCGGLHGHVKVSPVDGTVYVPNNNCNNEGAVVVSQDNGITWNVRPVQSMSVDTTSGSSDPAVGIDANGRVYFIIANADSSAAVGTSDDFGATWTNIVDVGAVYGITNVTYPAVVGGDGGRAAVAFYGSTTPGGSNDGSFTGLWHLYVAHTFDGGATWTTTDATPNAPMQRSGIWRSGGSDINRNLLDFFDITIDKQGRVYVGYINGCSGGNCAQAAPTAFGNGYTVAATFARESSGRRLIAAFDPPNPLTATSAPGMPFVTERRVGDVVYLGWNEADTGNSTITSYQILRGTASGGETLLATVPGTQTTYADSSAANPNTTYYYVVQAVNSVGTSCGNNEIAAPYVGDPCSGILIHQNDPSHPEATGGTAMAPPLPELLIDSVVVGEPNLNGANDLMFQMKVGDLTTIPPNSRWRMVWDSFKSPGEQYYVGMTMGASGTPTFEYGYITTAVVGLVLGLPTETMVGTPDPASNFQTDGTITIYVPKSAVGNPQPGDLLGAVNGRTLTGDTPETVTLERSTQLVDHTFCKSQADNTYPAATYTVAGNASCAVASAVSRKTHGSAGTFDVDLPLTGTPGIECRTGPTSGNHEVVVTFAAPVTVTSATVTLGPGGTGSVSSKSTSGNQAVVNLTNVSNAQTLSINLLGVSVGSSTGNVSVPMSVLLGDVDATGRVDGNDVSAVQSHTRQSANSTNFRYDVDVSGRIDGNDVSTTQAHTRTSLP